MSRILSVEDAPAILWRAGILYLMLPARETAAERFLTPRCSFSATAFKRRRVRAERNP